MTIDIEWGEVDGEKESETNWKKKTFAGITWIWAIFINIELLI